MVRLDVSNKLEKNYVKTVSFNADGNILVSGSVDKQIMLWDWETGIPRLTFESSHGDLWLVRHARISECGVETRLLAQHQPDAFDPAFEPGRPHLIYTCGEDRLVQHIDLRTEAATELLRCQPIGGCSVRNPVFFLCMLLQLIQGTQMSLQLWDRINMLAFMIFVNISEVVQLISVNL
ncbi:hypothetical protein V6N13_122077 [Hibiscus sabdariffa]